MRHLMTARLVLCRTSGKSAPFRGILADFSCHKIEKSARLTLSKAGAHWYIPPAPAALWAPGCLLRKPLGRKIGAADALAQLRFAPGIFSQGAQRLIAGWSSPVARQAHNLKVASSNLAPATKTTAKAPAIPGIAGASFP